MSWTRPPSLRSVRRFGVESVIVFGLIGCWLVFRKHHPIAGGIVGGAGVVVGLLSLTLPRAAWAVRSVWIGLAGLIGAVNSRILLAAAFLLVITPISLVRRLLRGAEQRGDTYWEPPSTKREPTHYEHPY